MNMYLFLRPSYINKTALITASNVCTYILDIANECVRTPAGSAVIDRLWPMRKAAIVNRPNNDVWSTLSLLLGPAIS